MENLFFISLLFQEAPTIIRMLSTYLYTDFIKMLTYKSCVNWYKYKLLLFCIKWAILQDFLFVNILDQYSSNMVSKTVLILCPDIIIIISTWKHSKWDVNEISNYFHSKSYLQIRTITPALTTPNITNLENSSAPQHIFDNISHDAFWIAVSHLFEVLGIIVLG